MSQLDGRIGWQTLLAAAALLPSLYLVGCINPAPPPAEPAAAESPTNPNQETARLNFVPEPTCGSPEPDWCVLARPLKWDDTTTTRTRNLFERLVQFQTARALISEFMESDYNALVRTETGFTYIDPLRRQPPVRSNGNSAWLANIQPWKGLYLMDGFIASGLITDPVGHFDVRLKVLLHEMFHVSDRLHDYSRSASFRDTYARVLSTIDVPRCRRLFAQWKRDTTNGVTQAAWTSARFGIQQLGTRTGSGRFVPSVAICGIEDRVEAEVEALAEFGSFWVLDPTAQSYFPTPVLEWLAATFESTGPAPH